MIREIFSDDGMQLGYELDIQMLSCVSLEIVLLFAKSSEIPVRSMVFQG